MVEHEFSLLLDGELTDERLDALHEAGCDDMTFSTTDGVWFADVNREAPTFVRAVRSAVDDIEKVEGVRVRQLEYDGLVTMAEIADRLGRSRESVRLLINGDRGPGGFPPPASHARARTKLWNWQEVAAWANVDEDLERSPRATSMINAALILRDMEPLPLEECVDVLSLMPVATDLLEQMNAKPQRRRPASTK